MCFGELTVAGAVEHQQDIDRAGLARGAWHVTQQRGEIERAGEQDFATTMIYTHVLNRGGRGVRSPADVLTQAADRQY